MTDQRKIDQLQYEIGSLEEKIRNLEMVRNTQHFQIKVLVDMITSIRDEYRKQKQYDLSDKIRDALNQIGIGVNDEN